MNLFHSEVFLEGLGIGAGLIIAIGAQNAFVLKQGILKRWVFMTALMCSCIDIFLITAGVLGLGAVISRIPVLTIAAAIGGAIFLFIYGIRSFLSVWKPAVLEENNTIQDKGNDLRSTILTLLAFSFLNPHVYLDTVVLLGGIGARHPAAERLSFIIGASAASIIWFFGLAYGSRVLTPLFQKKITWRILDFLIGLIMFYITFKLIAFAIDL